MISTETLDQYRATGELFTLPFDQRFLGITSTDIGKIMAGNSSDVFLAKVTERKKNVMNAAMKRGKRMEDVVIDYFEESAGVSVQPSKTYGRFINGVLFIATPDGELDNPERQALECKDIAGQFLSQWEREIPPQYIAQIHTVLLVCPEFSVGNLAALFHTDRAGLVLRTWQRLERDAGLADLIVDVGSRLWNNHITPSLAGNMTPPPFNDASKEIDYLRTVYKPERDYEVASAEDNDTYRRYRLLKAFEKALDASIDEHRAKLMRSIADHQGMKTAFGRIDWKERKTAAGSSQVFAELVARGRTTPAEIDEIKKALQTSTRVFADYPFSDAWQALELTDATGDLNNLLTERIK